VLVFARRQRVVRWWARPDSRPRGGQREIADESEQAGAAAVRMFSGMEVVVVVYCIAIHLYLIGVVEGAGLANTGSRTDSPSVPGAGSLWYTYFGTHTVASIHRAQSRGYFQGSLTTPAAQSRSARTPTCTPSAPSIQCGGRCEQGCLRWYGSRHACTRRGRGRWCGASSNRPHPCWQPGITQTLVNPGGPLLAAASLARYRANSPTLLCSVMIADLPFPFRRVHLSVRHSGIWICEPKQRANPN
jgi:hypothetical protein